MNLDLMRAEAYGHFLIACSNIFYRQIVFAHFALEELKLPPEDALFYTRRVMIVDENEIDSPDFDRFYTWYYINYVTNTPVKAPLYDPEWLRVSGN